MLYDLSANCLDFILYGETTEPIKPLQQVAIQPPDIASATHFTWVFRYLQNAVRSK